MRNRRALISILLVLTFLSGCKLDGLTERFLYNCANLKVSPSMVTGKRSQLVSFAHITDVHVTDADNPIRSENFKVRIGSNDVKLANLIIGTSRPYETSSSAIEKATVSAINAQNKIYPIDFVVNTGDNTDTSIQPEYIQAVENLNALDMPWYIAIGNHDVEYEGTVKTSELVTAILSQGINVDISELESKDKVISHLATIPAFKKYADQMAVNGHGNYSFDPNPFVHCIVLFDTELDVDKVADDLAGASQGSFGLITEEQFNWAINEIDRNKNKLCLIFAHHTLITNLPTPPANPLLANSAEMIAALQKRHNFIAWVCGHTHVNRIDPVATPDGWGFWSINTCSLIDYPAEWRQAVIEDLGNGTGAIETYMFERLPVYDANGNDVATLQKDNSKVQAIAYGRAEDRNTRLYFKLAPEVAQNVKSHR